MVGQRFSAQFSYSLLISELLSHISDLSLVTLMVMQIKLKPELFNDIHEDSGSHLGQTMSSVSIQPKLATVGFTGTNGTGTPPTHRKNTK